MQIKIEQNSLSRASYVKYNIEVIHYVQENLSGVYYNISELINWLWKESKEFSQRQHLSFVRHTSR